MNILDIFKKRGLNLRQINTEVAHTLESPGWKIVEDHFKHMLDSLYSSLMEVSPEELKKKQEFIKAIIEMLQKAYEMGGLEWNYDGYKTMQSTVFKDERHSLSLYEMAVDIASKKFAEKEEADA